LRISRIERALDGGIDLGPEIAICRSSDFVQIKLRRISFPPRKLDREDLFALGLIRQIDKEQLIETSLANQFGRQHRDVITGRGNEDRRLAVLHPGEKRSEQSRRNSGIG